MSNTSPLLRIEDLRPGMLVDWDKLPERMYRCKVVAVQPRYGTVRVRTVATVGKGNKEQPLYDEWVGVAQLRPATLASDWWQPRHREGETP